jgi:hypothetical protein
VPVDKHALDPSLGDRDRALGHRHLEEQAASVDLGQPRLGDDGASDRRGRLVVQLDPDADRGHAGRHALGRRHHGGRLGEREHPWRAQHGNVTRAHRLRGVGVGDGQLHPGGQPRRERGTLLVGGRSARAGIPEPAVATTSVRLLLLHAA